LKTAIIGPGSVGLALGSCLHHAGHPPCFVVRGDPNESPLARSGLHRTGIFGDVRIEPGELELSTVSGLAGRRLDFLLLCTKTTSNSEVAAALGEVWSEIHGEPIIVVCQNGWGNAEEFAEHLPKESIFSARIITGFRRIDPTRVEITVHADDITIGSLFGVSPQAAAPLVTAITRGGIPCQTSEAIGRDLWAKLLYNCLLNPLSALTGVRYGVLGERRETRALMEAIAREIFALMESTGHVTHWPDPDLYLSDFYDRILPPTARHESSMLQDLRAGRRTEIDALCGAVTRLAEQAGVPVPVNHALTVLVHAAQRPSQPQS
jgi:2-dehydropantoate 2-reductase